MTIMNGMLMKTGRIACMRRKTIANTTLSLMLNENDQQAYWGWRHEHSDTLLKIDIR